MNLLTGLALRRENAKAIARQKAGARQLVPEHLSDLTRLGERSALIIAAHPDDEAIGAGALLAKMSRVGLVTMTDGAPKKGLADRVAGFQSRSDYSKARRREAHAALALLGRDVVPCINLNVSDQQSVYKLPSLVPKLMRYLTQTGYDYVITHAYEGGHPDHDTAALAVQAACTLLRRSGAAVPTRVEMTGYHAKGDGLAYGLFLPHPDAGQVVSFPLGESERDLKRKMFRCYLTQRPVLAPFPLDTERFRLAPRYDFRLPPHGGPLAYERYNWEIDGAIWRRAALRALTTLTLLDG